MTQNQERNTDDNISESNCTRSSPTKLLEIGATPIKLIVGFLAHSQRGIKRSVPPRGLLQLAATCKKLRTFCSHILCDDKIWLSENESNGYNYEMELSSCVHVSEDIETPLIFPLVGMCTKKLCCDVHRIIPWYKLAGVGLRTFRFSQLVTILPTREANYVVEYISKTRTPLKEIRIDHIPTHAVPRVEALHFALKNLLKNTSSTLESLCVNLDNRICSRLIVDALCEVKLGSINSIQLDINGEDIDKKMHFAMRIIWHTMYCGAKVKKICFRGHGNNLQYIQTLAIICPYVSEVVFIQSDREEVSSVKSVFNFNSQILRFKGFRFNETQFEEFVQHVVAQEVPPELHFYECSLQYGGVMLSNKAFGKMIKTLVLNELHDVDTIRAICSSCKMLESLRIEFSVDAFPIISELISRSKYLNDVNLYCNGNIEEEDVNMLLNGFKETDSSIKHLTIRNILFKPKALGKLFSFLSDDLETIAIRCFRNQTYSVLSVKNIIKKIKRHGRMYKLRHLSVPLGKIELPLSLDIELGLLKIQKSLIDLRMSFKHLDVSRLETWIKRPSICSKCETPHFR